MFMGSDNVIDLRLAAAQLDDTSLGRLLQDAQLVTREKISAAVEYALANSTDTRKMYLGQALVLLEYIREDVLIAFLARQHLVRAHSAEDKVTHAATIVAASATGTAYLSETLTKMSGRVDTLIEKLNQRCPYAYLDPQSRFR
jgi:hypothetical protein